MINKAQLAQKLAQRLGISKKEAELMLAAFVDITIESLTQGESVNLAGFGAFSAKTRAGRIGVNPQDPSEKITIPPVTVAKFKAGQKLKLALKEKDGAPQMPSSQAPTQGSSDSLFM